MPDKYRDVFILEPEFDEKGKLSHDYYKSDISNIEMHGGVTFYSKEGGADDEPVVIKIGCDYGHLWDEGNDINDIIVSYDVRGTIDDLFLKYPEIKIRSFFYGGYYLSSEGEFYAHGNFVGNGDSEKWDIEYPKAKVAG